MQTPLGYVDLQVVVIAIPFSNPAPFAELLQKIQTGFGRTMARLPAVFGVSRQTLYNWLGGETPKPTHHEKLRQLAEAAQYFSEVGFKPTSLTPDRTISQGKSLLQLVREGADGHSCQREGSGPTATASEPQVSEPPQVIWLRRSGSLSANERPRRPGGATPS
ncbi:MAG: hypothetical protein FWD68_14965 [Alphaproteobacteria bacterium]|nr:hypothetical protein [Alphaproteobacteria bacterium]